MQLIQPVKKQSFALGWLQGVGLTLVIAVLAKNLVQIPLFSIMGNLVVAILLGMCWRAIMYVPDTAVAGISFTSKKLLRFGIILLGARLNLSDIVSAGPKVLAVAVIDITFSIFSVYWLAKWFKVEKRLGLLTAVGTAICGAAAVVAVAPQLKAKDEEIAVGVATVAILGTLFTAAYTLLFPLLGLSNLEYGLFAGSTLHEVAHVIAAASPVGSTAMDMAVIVKLTRVAFLIPIALTIGIVVNRSNRKETTNRTEGLPIPWFIVGFLVMSGVNTLGIFTQNLTGAIVNVAYFLIAMAMAGLGLNIEFSTLRKMGGRTLISGLIGSVLLSLLGFVLVKIFA